MHRCVQMRFDLINRLLHQYSTTLSAKVMKLDSVEMQDYAKLIDVEQRRLFSMKILPKWCRQVQPKNISMLKKQNSIKSQIQSHFSPYFQKQPQEELRNRFQKHNSVMTECYKRKYLLQIIR